MADQAEIGQLGKNDIQELAFEPPGESAEPDNSVEMAVKLMKIQKMIEGNKSPFANIAKKELEYWNAAAEALTNSPKLKHIYGYDFKAVSKVAELLRSHVESRAAKKTLTEAAAQQLEDLQKSHDNEVYKK
jgi:hypothetical protein